MKIRHFHIFSLMLLALSLAITAPSFAQPSDIAAANCEELKDPDVKFELDLCSAHVGCRLVMGIQKTCVKAKKFIGNIKNVFTRDEAQAKEAQAADTSLFGKLKSFVSGLGTKEVNANQVFEANMSDEMRAAQANDKDWRTKGAPIAAGVLKADKSVVTGETPNGSKWTYIGDVKDGKANGWGAQYWSTGQILRGEFKGNNLNGQGDSQTPGNFRTIGAFNDGSANGEAMMLQSNGRVTKGNYSNGRLDGYGAMYGADGVLLSKGVWRAGSLSVGDIYDAQGNITQSIDKPRDERLAQEAAEQELRNQLSSMTAPQLFAKADELANSDRNKANRYRQALLSRFPNHTLAVRLNEQIAAEKAAQVEAQRQQAEAQRRQELLAQQQAEQARLRAEAEQQEKDARFAQNLQNATKFLEALSGAIQQSKQGSSSNNSDDPCPNGGNPVNGQCRFGVAQ